MRLMTPIRASAKRCVASMALAALLLTACGGGSDAPLPPPPPPPPVAAWQAPQIAPVSATSVLVVQSDGADGVFVVGATNNDGLIVQRFSASSGWFGQTVELRGLKNLQAVALDDGVALFGRDDASWYRRDYTMSGLKPIQTMFAVDFRNSARTEVIPVTFSRTHDGAILAMAFVQDADPSRGNRIQTREYRAGVWSAPLQSALVLPGSAGAFNPEIMVDVVRSKTGDVARVRYQTLAIISYVAYRAPGDTAFAAITPELCSGARSCTQSGSYGSPALEFDGAVTVPVFRSALETDQWLAIRSNVPTQLWPVGIITKLTSFLPIARLLRADGTPIWLTSSTGALALWEGAARVEWTAEASGLVPCVSRICAAISSPDADHISALQTPVPGTAKLYVSDRGGDARWAQSAAVEASLLQSGALTGTRLHIVSFLAKGPNQIVIGYAEATTTTLPPGPVWPFAFVKR